MEIFCLNEKNWHWHLKKDLNSRISYFYMVCLLRLFLSNESEKFLFCYWFYMQESKKCQPQYKDKLKEKQQLWKPLIPEQKGRDTKCQFKNSYFAELSQVPSTILNFLWKILIWRHSELRFNYFYWHLWVPDCINPFLRSISDSRLAAPASYFPSHHGK